MKTWGLVAALSAIVLTPVVAASQEAPWTPKDAYHEESSEEAECVAYYSLAQHCASASGFRDTATELGQAAESAQRLWELLGAGSGASKSAMIAFLHMALSDQLSEINKSCMNIAVIADKYGLFCKSIVEKPQDRLQILLAGPPSDNPP